MRSSSMVGKLACYRPKWVAYPPRRCADEYLREQAALRRANKPHQDRVLENAACVWGDALPFVRKARHAELMRLQAHKAQRVARERAHRAEARCVALTQASKGWLGLAVCICWGAGRDRWTREHRQAGVQRGSRLCKHARAGCACRRLKVAAEAERLAQVRQARIERETIEERGRQGAAWLQTLWASAALQRLRQVCTPPLPQAQTAAPLTATTPGRLTGAAAWYECSGTAIARTTWCDARAEGWDPGSIEAPDVRRRCAGCS